MSKQVYSTGIAAQMEEAPGHIQYIPDAATLKSAQELISEFHSTPSRTFVATGNTFQDLFMGLADIQQYINNTPSEIRGHLSDGYHTFNELYDHRCQLFITLCRVLHRLTPQIKGGWEVWRSTTHSDGEIWQGWFLLGIGTGLGLQMTYHLPMRLWEQTSFAATLEKAPVWDGHTSADVLDRLQSIIP